jgi:hypothetical protein
MVGFSDIRLSLGQLVGHFVDSRFGSLDDGFELSSLGASIIQGTVKLVCQTRGSFVESLDIVSWSAVLHQQTLGASWDGTSVTIKSYRLSAMTDAGPAGVLAVGKVVGRRVG